MSDNQGQSEPSMEEILASIRRIISEEDSDEAKPGGEPPAAEAGPPEPEPESDPEPEPESEPPAAPAGEGDDDVLELTEMEALPEDEPEDVLDLDEAEALPEAPEVSEPPEPAEPVEAAAPPAAAAEAEVAQREVAEEAASEAGERPGGGDLREGLVSASTAAATTAALSELTRLRRVPASAATPPGGESLEAFVARQLEPHLREWLDANLEALVERVVRDEVRRLARRAEEE